MRNGNQCNKNVAFEKNFRENMLSHSDGMFNEISLTECNSL